MMKQREERLMEHEQALAVKEREMERRRLLLEQQLEAQRKEELEGPNEEEILMREKQLNERTQQMQAKERGLEELEAAVKHQSLSTLKLQQQKDRTLLDRKGDDERDSNKLPTSEHRFISEEELKAELLKNRLMQSSTRRSGRVFEDDLNSEKRPTKSIEEKDTEQRISLEKNFPFPKITAFSGEENRPKGEASYEEWRYEVKCLQRDGVYSKYVIGQAIRKSLRGPAKREIIQMGPTATVEEIMERLESTFANVATGMSVMQEFFTASQKQEESVAAWALRLEEIMQNAIDKGQIKEEEKDDLLRDKFWRSLRSERLKNATRIDFRTVSNFKRLVKAVRTEELSMKTNANAQYQAVTTNVTKKEERKDGIENEKQGQVYQTLMDLRKGLKIYNKKRGRGRGRQWNQNQEQNQRPGQRWNQYENQQQRNQQPGNQQQGNQQKGNQQQGNQYGRDQQELQRSQTKQEPSTQQDSQQQGQQSTKRSESIRLQTFKHVGVSVVGQTGDKRQNSPKKIDVMSRLIGNGNETSVEINGIETLALIDSGSQITTISEDFYNSMSPKPVLYSIEELGLKIEGAGGHILSYMGAIACSLEVPFLHNQLIETAALVLPTTDYSLQVPVIVGTNAINRCREKCESTTETIPTQWKNALSLCNVHTLEL